MDKLSVTQADRDFASAVVRAGVAGCGNGNKVVASGIKGGLHDNYYIVQLAAQYRIASQAELREALEGFVGFFDEAMKGFTPDWESRQPDEHVVLGWNNASLRIKHFRKARATLSHTKGEAE